MEKKLGLLSIFCISAGAMISSGLFVLPGLAFAKAGPVVFLAYFAAGLVALTTVLSLSELITAMPKGGGDYYYVSRTFGPLFGTVSGLLSWLALSLKSAFAIIGIAELVYLTFGIQLYIPALALTLLFTLLNLLGVKEAVRFQIVLVLALLALLGVFTVSGLRHVAVARFDPFLPRGVNALFSTAGFVFVSFGGVLTTASIAGEIRNPARNIPAGLIGSTVVVTIVYSIVIFVLVGVLPAEQLKQSLAPVASAASATGGSPMYLAIMIASLLAFITTANGGILTASRYPMALARDGMLFHFLKHVSKRRGTPYPAVIATGALIGGAVLLELDMLIKAASTVILLSNIFAHLSVIVMRESRIANYRPTFRAPLYPWLQIAGIIVFVLLIVDMGREPILFSLLFISAGVFLYFVRSGRQKRVSPALLHLVERLTSKKLGTEHLPDELREIVADRDGIIRDEFDHVVDESAFLDLKGTVDHTSFLSKIAVVIRRSLPFMDAREVRRLFCEREAEGSTAISDFVAVPHIIIETPGVFSLFFVRARDGIVFSRENPSVRAVFVLIGSRDKRTLHLRALSAIAQVASGDDFEERWLAARDHTEVKDLFLLSPRRRF
ncbi:amino acid permease [bacterium]|nr:amino acid permease [bacterium]